MSTRTTEAPAPLTLAERLDAARKAEAAPHQRAAELDAALTAAVERRDFAEAGRLEPEVQAAREAAALAAAATRALAEGAAAVDAERQRRQSARDLAERQSEAQLVIAEAMAAERQGLAAIGERVERMWEHLAEAKAVFLEAQELEFQVGRARRRIAEARVAAGEMDCVPGHIQAPNAASVIADREELVRILSRWNR